MRCLLHCKTHSNNLHESAVFEQLLQKTHRIHNAMISESGSVTPSLPHIKELA